MSRWWIGGCLALLVVGCIWVLVNYLDTLFRSRRRYRQSLLMRRSVSDLVYALVGESSDRVSLPVERAACHHRLLAELVARLSESVYGAHPVPLARLLCRSGTDQALLRAVRRSRGCRRASLLMLLAKLPPLECVSREAAYYLNDPSREVRFAALMVALVGDPSRVFRHIAEFGEALTMGEVGEILHLLRRGLLPVAYRPLVTSENSNLRRLGLAVVRHFSIEEAEEELLLMVDEVWDRELALVALYALCALHRPLHRRAVVACVHRMNREQRGELMRHMAREGYSLQQVRMLLDGHQRRCYAQLVESYKRSLVCG